MPEKNSTKRAKSSSRGKTSMGDAEANAKKPPRISPGRYHDLANAERFAVRVGQELRWVPKLGHLAWDGKCWRLDSELRAEQLASLVAKEIEADARAMEADGGTREAQGLAMWAQRSNSEPRIKAMVSLARPMLLTRREELDRDQFVLNVDNGLLDLRTRELRPHDADALCTAIARASFQPGATAPRWEQFLDEVTLGDRELKWFLQRAVGYSLTGDTREQVLFFLEGRGSNGKTAFLEMLRRLLGDYAKTATFDTFTESKHAEHRNDLARLSGARFVAASETGEGAPLAEAVLKAATGGEPLVARYLHREFFEFTPRFKLWFAGNHRPRVSGTDEGVWRRILLIPFRADFRAAPDKELVDKLTAELPGILNWALEGCRQWLELGELRPAQVVREASASYRQEEDELADFVGDVCDLGQGLTCAVRALRTAYVEYCKAAGVRPRSPRTVNRRLVEIGCVQERTPVLRYWRGISIRPANLSTLLANSAVAGATA